MYLKTGMHSMFLKWHIWHLRNTDSSKWLKGIIESQHNYIATCKRTQNSILSCLQSDSNLLHSEQSACRFFFKVISASSIMINNE